MILFTHPTGNQNVRHAALALEEAGLLSEFWTSIAWRKSNALEALLPRSLVRELQRRAFPEEIESKVRTSPWYEAARLASQRLRLPADIRQYFSVDAIYRHLDRCTANRIDVREFYGVYAYEDGSKESFRTAKKLGMVTIYDLPIGYWRAGRDIYREEAERMPEWRSTLPGLGDDEAKLDRKDEELRLADAVLVASRFTAESLRKAPFAIPDPIVIPYGCASPSPQPSFNGDLVPRRGAPLRVLFVGSLSQRKGIYELFRAVEALGDHATLTLVGGKVGDCPARDPYLEQHRWIPTLAHSDVLRLMREHDVLVFPSLFEGFGLVVTEALSQGLPVITTPNTCGPDILTEAEDGFIVPIRDWETIAARLETLDRDRSRLVQMKLNARSAAARQPWTHYRQGVVNAVREVLAVHTKSV